MLQVRRRQHPGRVRRRRGARRRRRARRACGLALLALGKVLGAEVQAAHGHSGFDVRVGIHTGGVLLGGGVDAEGSIRGIAVNIAARMEQTAPPLAGCASATTPTPWCAACSRSRPRRRWWSKAWTSRSQSYLVPRAKPRSFRVGTRGIEGVATRMIGRDAELEALQDAFKRLFIDRNLAAVTVVADAGIGKSRLLYEFAAWTDARPERFYLLPRPRHAADARAALRLAARPYRLAIPDRRRRQHRDCAPKDGAGHRPAVPGRRRSRLVGRPCPPARPSDRHRVARESPCQGHPRRPQADPQPRLPRRGAAVPAHRVRRFTRHLAARRPALGRQREPGLPRLPGGGRSRRAAADAVLLPADAVRTQGEAGVRRRSIGGSTCNRSART